MELLVWRLGQHIPVYGTWSKAVSDHPVDLTRLILRLDKEELADCRPGTYTVNLEVAKSAHLDYDALEFERIDHTLVSQIHLEGRLQDWLIFNQSDQNRLQFFLQKFKLYWQQ